MSSRLLAFGAIGTKSSAEALPRILAGGTRRTLIPEGLKTLAAHVHVPQNEESHSSPSDRGWLTRERAVALSLVVITCAIGYLCYRLILPFLAPLAWALALALIAHPLHRWIKRRIPHSNSAAAISVVIVALVIVTPAIFVTQHLVRETTNAVSTVQDALTSGRWRLAVEKHARLKPIAAWLETELGLGPHENTAPPHRNTSVEGVPATKKGSPPSQITEHAATTLTNGVGTLLTGTASVVMQLFITFMTLFFFFRDGQDSRRVLKSLMPLSSSEADEVFVRVDDAIHATIFGSVVVAIIQGSMGGLMFWWLGLSSPLLWGAIMALLAVVPVLGTFVIWAPTAAYLALLGDWTKALVLAAWGGIAIALIDNLLYPYLVGNRLRFHTLLVFFAIAGGLMLFGASGVILGPLLLAVADALLEIWRQRTTHGGTVEKQRG